MKASVPALNEEGPQRRLSPPDDPLLVLLRQTDGGNDRALVLVNTQEREARDVVVQGLLSAAGLDRIDEQPMLTDALAEGGARPVLARFRVAPLDVRVLHAAPRPVRHVPVAPCPDVGRDPGHRPEWRPDARILIEDVWPEIDAGRYPIKRVVGDEVTVWADIFRDGHDKIRAVLKYAFEKEDWRETPFSFFDNDRWMANFRPDRVGRWRYTVEAWTDHFESWRADLVKKQEAGQKIAVELVEGERLVEAGDQARRRGRRGAAARDRGGIRQGRDGGAGGADAVRGIARADGARRSPVGCGAPSRTSWRSSSIGSRRGSLHGTRCSRAARAPTRPGARPSTT